MNIFSTKSILFFIPTVCVFLLAIVYIGMQRDPGAIKLTEQFDNWGVTLKGLDNFGNTRILKRKIGEYHVTDVYATHNKKVAKIRRISQISQDMAERHTRERIVGINTLFDEMVAPYPGVVTKQTQCPKEFYPQYFEQHSENSDWYSFYIYSNDRFNYGICSHDLVTYEAILAYVYCRGDRALYRFEIFSPRGEFEITWYDKLKKSFLCQDE